MTNDSTPSPDTDGRDLFQPDSRYSAELRKEQKREGIYIGALLAANLITLAGVGVGTFISFIPVSYYHTAQRFTLAALGGLLGGLVYDGKWLYHSIARGLWHQDRRLWRILSPWLSVGTTVGIWSLMSIGFFPPVSESPTDGRVASLATPVGTGFVIGYLSDRFLAKMKELTEVLFGTARQQQRTKDEDELRDP